MKKAIVLLLTVLMMAFTVPAFADGYGDDTLTKSKANAASILISNSVSKRGFAIPSEPNFPMMPGYYGAAIPGSQFQSLKALLMYKNFYTKEEIYEMAKGPQRIKITTTKVIDIDGETPGGCTVLLQKPGNAQLVGFMTVAVKGNAVSVQALAEAMKKAMKMGGDLIHVTAEGANRKLEASGWGIGLNMTHATMNGGGEGTSNVSSGGTGISGGSAGYEDKPWLQLFVLRTK